MRATSALPPIPFGGRLARAYIPGMADKPAPQPDADRYSEEETDRRRDATIRAMVGMKPKPRQAKAKRERAEKGETQT